MNKNIFGSKKNHYSLLSDKDTKEKLMIIRLLFDTDLKKVSKLIEKYYFSHIDDYEFLINIVDINSSFIPMLYSNKIFSYRFRVSVLGNILFINKLHKRYSVIADRMLLNISKKR